MNNIQRGNQPLSKSQSVTMVSTIEPYLKAGLSIREACRRSRIPRGTLYKIMDRYPDLRDQILAYKDYLSVITSVTLAKHLHKIHQKSLMGIDLTKRELHFLMWFATNSRACAEEFGKPTKGKSISVDPYDEMRKLNEKIEQIKGGLDG